MVILMNTQIRFSTLKKLKDIYQVNNMIYKHLDLDFTNAKDTLTYYSWKESKLSEEYLKQLNSTISTDSKYKAYNVKVKYNTLTKEFEINIKVAKSKFDEYLARGSNKLQKDDQSKVEISKYMDNLYKEVLNLLNTYIKYVNQYRFK